MGSFQTIAQSTTEKIIHLEPFMGFQNYEHFKRLVLLSPDAPIEFLEGFDFVWGYHYEVMVKETRLEYPLSDGTQYNYSFVELLNKSKASDSLEFRLFLDANPYYHNSKDEAFEIYSSFQKVNDTSYLYFEKVEIQVPKHMLARFNDILSGERASRATFRFIGENQIRLTSW